ncbi:MAG: GTP-binding protein [Polyangiaceae bacterium]
MSANDTKPLRCATAGSVDDGKSTLIGRLLFDSKSLMTDQIAHVDEASKRRGLGRTDLALLTDGLRAEREQGITIDVAWRYFATPKRRFVLADAPGHVQYTCNTVTACSTAEVAIVLIDARKSMTEQTRRHLFVARLLGVKSLVLAINKMDAVDHSHEVFVRVRDDVTAYLSALPKNLRPVDVSFVPVAALTGDNVVEPTRAMPWYDGPPLLQHLESLPNDEQLDAGARFPVQWVIRPQSDDHPDYRGYAGRLASGTLSVGQQVRVAPKGRETTITKIETARGDVAELTAGVSATVHLKDDIDVSRGDMIVALDDGPRITREIEASITWLHETPARVGGTYWLRHTTREVKATLESVDATFDVLTGAEIPFTGTLGLNDLGRVRLKTSAPLCVDAYRDRRATGALVLVDASTGETVAGAMVLPE